jgi:hypothetical protein
LLASGILGALVQFSASAEGQAIAKDLRALPSQSFLAGRVSSFGPWLNVSKFLTPTVIMGIFGFLMLAIFG